MKLNSLTNQTPINININNININNYNYYNGNQPLYLKRRINTAEVNDTFPMITKTVPNEVNIGNMFNSNNNIFKHRTNRIKLINLKKKKGMNTCLRNTLTRLLVIVTVRNVRANAKTCAVCSKY